MLKANMTPLFEGFYLYGFQTEEVSGNLTRNMEQSTLFLEAAAAAAVLPPYEAVALVLPMARSLQVYMRQSLHR